MKPIEVTVYWCPTKKNYVDCPGPCPDGTKHTGRTAKLVDVRPISAKEARNLQK